MCRPFPQQTCEERLDVQGCRFSCTVNHLWVRKGWNRFWNVTRCYTTLHVGPKKASLPKARIPGIEAIHAIRIFGPCWCKGPGTSDMRQWQVATCCPVRFHVDRIMRQNTASTGCYQGLQPFIPFIVGARTPGASSAKTSGPCGPCGRRVTTNLEKISKTCLR